MDPKIRFATLAATSSPATANNLGWMMWKRTEEVDITENAVHPDMDPGETRLQGIG